MSAREIVLKDFNVFFAVVRHNYSALLAHSHAVAPAVSRDCEGAGNGGLVNLGSDARAGIGYGDRGHFDCAAAEAAQQEVEQCHHKRQESGNQPDK